MASSPLRAAAGQQQSRLLDMQKKFQQKHLAAVGAVKGGAAGNTTTVGGGDQPVPPVRRFGGQQQQRQSVGAGEIVSGDGDSLVQVDVKGKRPTGRVNNKTVAAVKKPPATVNGNVSGGGSGRGGKAATGVIANGKHLLLPPVVQSTVINALAAGASAASAVATVNAAANAAGPGVQKPLVKAAGKLPPAQKPAAAPRRRVVQAPVKAPDKRPAVVKRAPAAAAVGRPQSVNKLRQPSADRGPPAAGMARCPLCARDFAADRLPKHEAVCRTTRDRDRKRKVFDTSKKRLQSVAAEAGVDVASLKKKTEKEDQRVAEKLQKKKDAWRRKHDALVRNVRAARAVQRHLAAGGSVRDLPPELEGAGADADDDVDSDLMRCPHCNRTFNEASAERHIPQCAERKRHAAARMQNKKR